VLAIGLSVSRHDGDVGVRPVVLGVAMAKMPETVVTETKLRRAVGRALEADAPAETVALTPVRLLDGLDGGTTERRCARGERKLLGRRRCPRFRWSRCCRQWWCGVNRPFAVVAEATTCTTTAAVTVAPRIEHTPWTSLAA